MNSIKEYNSSQDFEREMIPHYKYFIKVAANLTRNEDDAKDLVQEAYIRAYRFYHTFEKDTNAKAWMYRILKNLFINYAAKKQKAPHLLSNYEKPDTLPWFASPDKDTLMSDEFVKAINSIKDEYRMVIILYHLEDYSIEDISNFMKWPVGTVKSRLFRARRTLRSVIKEYSQDKTAVSTFN
jgi:RNA polymerase sigma-70 factor, ECF subfamily